MELPVPGVEAPVELPGPVMVNDVCPAMVAFVMAEPPVVHVNCVTLKSMVPAEKFISASRSMFFVIVGPFAFA